MKFNYGRFSFYSSLTIIEDRLGRFMLDNLIDNILSLSIERDKVVNVRL